MSFRGAVRKAGAKNGKYKHKPPAHGLQHLCWIRSFASHSSRDRSKQNKESFSEAESQKEEKKIQKSPTAHQRSRAGNTRGCGSPDALDRFSRGVWGGSLQLRLSYVLPARRKQEGDWESADLPKIVSSAARCKKARKGNVPSRKRHRRRKPETPGTGVHGNTEH